MTYSVIDKQKESHSFGFLLKETIEVILTLVEKTPDHFAIGYEFNYSGIRNGSNTSGDPMDVAGNAEVVASTDPRVVYTIANYSDSGVYVSMQVTIVVDIPVIGTKTVFDKVLGGQYGANNLRMMVDHVASISQRT